MYSENLEMITKVFSSKILDSSYTIYVICISPLYNFSNASLLSSGLLNLSENI